MYPIACGGRMRVPKSMMWTEWLFSKLPFYDRGLKYQIVIRFLFVLMIWLIGLLVAIVDGRLDFYIHWYQIYFLLFGALPIVLIGGYNLTIALDNTINSFEPLFDMERGHFERFKRRTNRFSGSTIGILAIAIVLFVTAQSGLDFSAWPRSIWGAWTYILIFLINFVMSTGIWMGASLWMTIFYLSRQPFKPDVSSNTVEKFRGITSLTLVFAIFYFIAITITMVVPILTENTSVLYDLLFSPAILFIALGVAGTLLPFYNIHNTLVSIKRRLLKSLDREFERWQVELDAALLNPEGITHEQTMLIMSNLFRLEMRERRTLLAPEWPFDINFVSKLLAVILIPAIVRIFVDIYSRTYLLPP